MFCTSCGAQAVEPGGFCAKCGKPAGNIGSTAPGHSTGFGKDANAAFHVANDAVPDGVKGWSWGAFLLNWIWAIGNRTWIGLLALIPYVGFLVAIWLGFKGREMAWKNREWDSLEHFNRVQKSWSRWGVGLIVGVFLLGVLAAIALPAYQGFVQGAQQNTF